MIGTVKAVLNSQPAPAEVVPYSAARAICRQHARSFYFCSFFLPIEKRSAAFAVYAFCRLLKRATEADSASDAAVQLAAWRRKLDAVYAGGYRPADNSEEELATVAFAEAVDQYHIPRQHFVDLARGCELDLANRRYATWADLQAYSYHAAGVIGLIMCRVLGLKSASAREQAVQMGTAMHLTRILRDVQADLQRDRIYLPQEDMERFGVSEADLAAGKSNGSFHHLMQFEINRARMLYREASQGLCQLPQDGSRLAASVLAVVDAGILNAIERHDYDVFNHRAELTTFQKLRRLPMAWRLCRRNNDHPLPDVFAAG